MQTQRIGDNRVCQCGHWKCYHIIEIFNNHEHVLNCRDFLFTMNYILKGQKIPCNCQHYVPENIKDWLYRKNQNHKAYKP